MQQHETAHHVRMLMVKCPFCTAESVCSIDVALWRPGPRPLDQIAAEDAADRAVPQAPPSKFLVPSCELQTKTVVSPLPTQFMVPNNELQNKAVASPMPSVPSGELQKKAVASPMPPKDAHTLPPAAALWQPASAAASSAQPQPSDPTPTVITPTVIESDVEEDLSRGLPTGFEGELDFYGRYLKTPDPEPPKQKIYRYGDQLVIGQREEHGVRILKYLNQ